MKKVRNKDLNELVIKYQITPTDKLEVEIYNSIITLINHFIYGLTNDKIIQQDLLSDSWLPYKRSLETYNSDIQFASYAMLNIRRYLVETFNKLYRVNGINLKSNFASVYTKNKNNELLSNSEKLLLGISSIKLNTPIGDGNTTLGDTLPGVEQNPLQTYNNFSDFYFKTLKQLLLDFKPPMMNGLRPRRIKEERLFEWELCSGIMDDKLTFQDVAELTGTSKQQIHQVYLQINKKIKEVVEFYDLNEFINELLNK